MPKRNGRRSLVREGEPSQTTDQGVEIPIPKRKDVLGLFDKAARRVEVPSESSRGKRRTRRAP
jgi:hypothetical protein